MKAVKDRAGQPQINTLFLDIGGVLLTNGWDRQARALAAETFDLDFAELDERHHLTYDTYEEGKLSLDEYLRRAVFYQERPFSYDDFKAFMYQYSQPLPEMLGLIRRLKTRYHLHTVAVSNEGRELTEYRVEKFDLAALIDAFISSSFVHLRKPDVDLYRLALDISQARPEQVIYLDDRLMFIEVARGLGMHSIHHKDFRATQTAFAQLGLF